MTGKSELARVERLASEADYNAAMAESDVVIQIEADHAIVKKERLGTSEIRIVSYLGSKYLCYRLL